MLMVTTAILVACNTSTLSMSELDIVPNNVQDKIDSNYKLQLIYEGEDIAYIIYQSKGTVATDLETQGDKLKVKLDETNKQDDVTEQHVYKLTLDPEHEVIDVLINGKSTAIDNVSSL
ncbi:peptidylprolyl isomerase [Bacillus massilinigeriensis]|uniref:peptidylprolyl isomerase n=1 Tax=Bacillus massilionigeriensis TaxID=1805475 RepID=UPI0013563CA2|nr:peptidylprolyl isomerase [Bacillus massilionigeriensis]